MRRTLLLAALLCCSGWAGAQPAEGGPPAEVAKPDAEAPTAPPATKKTAEPLEPAKATPPPKKATEAGAEEPAAPVAKKSTEAAAEAPAAPLAKQPTEAAAEPAKTAPAASKASERAPTTPVASPKTSPELEEVARSARSFFGALLAADARTAVEYSAFPFQLEDRQITRPDELLQELLKSLRSKRTDLLSLSGIEVLTATEMEKKYGRPPPRLGSFPWRASRTYVAVGNVSGHAVVVLVRETTPGVWRVAGYHD